MKFIFVIEDEWHAEWSGQYPTFELALEEIQRRSHIPWNEAPNCAPCTSWRTCGRRYYISKSDSSTTPWTFIELTHIVEIDAKGVRWEPEFEPPK